MQGAESITTEKHRIAAAINATRSGGQLNELFNKRYVPGIRLSEASANKGNLPEFEEAIENG